MGQTNAVDTGFEVGNLAECKVGVIRQVSVSASDVRSPSKMGGRPNPSALPSNVSALTFSNRAMPVDLEQLIYHSGWVAILDQVGRVLKKPVHTVRPTLDIRRREIRLRGKMPIKGLCEALYQSRDHSEGYKRTALHLLGLVRDLDDIAAYGPLCYDALVRRYHREVSSSSYNGWRCEVTVAAELSRLALPWRYNEHTDGELGDFTVHHGADLTIECQALDVVKLSLSDYSSKIRNAIIKKARKPYAGPSTLLVLNIDAPYWERIHAMVPMTKSEIIRNGTGHSGLGALTFATTTFYNEGERLIHGPLYDTVVYATAAEELRLLMGRLFTGVPREIRNPMHSRIS